MKAHRAELEATAPKTLSYGKRMAMLKRDGVVSTAVPCVIPTKDGYDCLNLSMAGHTWCGPHKRTVGKRLVLLLTGSEP